MSGFDTSGEVRTRWDMAIQWHQLTPFQQGYVEALFESLEQQHAGGSPMLRHPDGLRRIIGFSSLADTALARIMADCEAIQVTTSPPPYPNTAFGGAAFWRTRQGGFIGAPALFEPVHREFRPLAPFLSEDGKIHLRGTQA